MNAKQCEICRFFNLNTCFVLGECDLGQLINEYCQNYEKKCPEFSLDLKRLQELQEAQGDE